jgi:hypothetical protein
LAGCASLAARCAERTVTPGGDVILPGVAPGTAFDAGALDALSAVVMALALNATASDKATCSPADFMSISLL